MIKQWRVEYKEAPWSALVEQPPAALLARSSPLLRAPGGPYPLTKPGDWEFALASLRAAIAGTLSA